MASTVFDLSLRVTIFTLTIAMATFTAYADEKPCNAVTSCRLGKEKLIVKTTVTPIPYHKTKNATYSKYEMEVRSHIAIKPINDKMETVPSESTSMAAHCNFEETTPVDLGALLEAGEGALVTLVAGETRLTAHRAVLAARSPVFAAMVCHGRQDASSGQVAIPDVEGPVLRQLLAYLYTLKAPQIPSMATQLLAAADKFGLSALKADCEVQVAAQLAVETAAATAVLAIRHSSTSLRQAAIAFIRAHLVQVNATEGWADAMHYQPEYVNEVYRMLAEPPAETRTTAAAGSQPTTEAQSLPHSGQWRSPLAAAPDIQPTTEAQSLSHTGHRQAPATSAPPTPPRQTPPPDDAVSRLRHSAEEKGRMLIQAAKEGRVEEVAALLAAGADVGARDRDRMTALHWAAAGGLVDAARRLLGVGAEVDAMDSLQWTPLHRAAWSGHVAVVRLLLASYADPNARTVDGYSPLHLAAYRGHAETAAALLEAGADRGAKTDKGRTPLDIARLLHKQQLIDMLT